ncbi:MAG: type II toxin-antitoxin system VapC family toxin [Bifidobacteriaceae bacterium]|jgi:predicted nucleic acid-binding protein|nr:type II toxin-antitoxin system VapC family toxin [Bifidobacteriaceae bacterium]
MLLLDTMVVSDIGKTRIEPALRHWAKTVDLAQAFISVVSLEEIELGILLKARQDPVQAGYLRRWFSEAVLGGFQGRILPIDSAVALQAAALHLDRTCPANDARITATALVHQLTVVTRNVTDYAGTGVALINPYA